MIPFPDERGYPVRLRRTGQLLGFIAHAMPDDRPWLDFWVAPPASVRPPDPGAPLRPLPNLRLVWDHERRCLLVDSSDFLHLEGATQA